MPDPKPAGTALDALAVARWFETAGRDLPWREPDATPWQILVSEVMLQQTPVTRVLPRWLEWREAWPTAAAFAAAPVADVLRAWGSLGYPRRALRLHETARAIVERHGGEVPSDLDELLALPGVGSYTARAVACFAFGKRVPVVDINVRRVIARAVDGYADAGPAREKPDLAGVEALLPADEHDAVAFSAGMMELGQVLCRPSSPGCVDCPIENACAWRQAGYPARSLAPRPKQATFEGSDRQARGRILKALRESGTSIPAEMLVARGTGDSEVEERIRRAIHTLEKDGLIERDGELVALPGAATAAS